jgi:hypothetical protein
MRPTVRRSARPARDQAALDRRAALDRLRQDPALSDTDDPAVKLIVELLTPDAVPATNTLRALPKRGRGQG